MSPAPDGPRAITSLAVTADDVVAALEARSQRARPVVLRVTPPFSGRMRARIHVADADDTASDPSTASGREQATPLHVHPRAFVDEETPAYPRPADTEDDLRADSETEYTVDRHHEYHRERVAEWREAVHDHFVGETTVETPGGPIRVDVTVLG